VGGDFGDLIAWREAVALAGDVASLARGIRGAGAWSAADQMLRAAESIPANIAEGYGRGLGRDFARFLRVAGASAAELESHLRVASVTGRAPAARLDPAIARTRRVRALIRGLAQSVAGRQPLS
jgi:four helix bundle protein